MRVSRDIGKRLDELRKYKGLSYDRLSEISGVARKALFDICHGKDCNVTTLQRILQGLGVEFEIFVILDKGKPGDFLAPGAKKKRPEPSTESLDEDIWGDS